MATSFRRWNLYNANTLLIAFQEEVNSILFRTLRCSCHLFTSPTFVFRSFIQLSLFGGGPVIHFKEAVAEVRGTGDAFALPKH